ncbi:Putative Mg2+ and Co2+ transporter CorB [Mycoplasmopsis californica]|uniref:Hemolysin family protein n=1 Tax=Mycoplasmopsis equigenitalium TaxID=114883 RepID=A0ABY5J1H5_9BACT|nr:hemolysin family protein [Mycoplasmopsis equigenitalium]UUD36840.1 hemolysin family protein [Mycoplasmopsis equigenitalium]VEU69864.1 Putative Mg2+ and Co2+ transporter CorB [Mycoplasmopsis californica]
MRPTEIIIYSIVLFILIVLSAIFSGAEMAYSSMNPGQLQAKIKANVAGSRLIKKHINKFNMLLSTILIGNNIVNIAASTLISLILSRTIANDGMNAVISTAILTPIIVIFGEITPKIVAKAHPFGYLKIVCFFIEVWFWVFWPFTFLLSKISRKALVTNTENELKHTLDIAAKEGVLDKDEAIIANNALDLDSQKVSKHYVKLQDIDYLPYDATIKQAKELMKETYFSRVPILKDEQFVGIIHLKDIFDAKQTDNVMQYIKTVPLISSNSTLSSALDKMRQDKSQMGFVVKNNSSTETLGLITIEDILEELVGEIYDEFDEEEDITELSIDRFQIKPSTPIREVAKSIELEIELAEDESENISFIDWLKARVDEQRITRATRYTYKDIFTVKVVGVAKNKEYIFELILI